MILGRTHWTNLALALQHMATGVRTRGGPAWEDHARLLDKVRSTVVKLRERDVDLEPDGPALLRDARSRATLEALLERLSKGH